MQALLSLLLSPFPHWPRKGWRGRGRLSVARRSTSPSHSSALPTHHSLPTNPANLPPVTNPLNLIFFRRFGTKCSGCDLGISPQDLVRKAKDKVFHLKCFTCFVCRKQLLTGEELYVVDDTKFVCKEDYTAGGRGLLNDSLYDDDEELDDEESRLEGEDGQYEPKHGEANNNLVSGLCPSPHSKTPPLADSSTERDMLNDSEGEAPGYLHHPILPTLRNPSPAQGRLWLIGFLFLPRVNDSMNVKLASVGQSSQEN